MGARGFVHVREVGRTVGGGVDVDGSVPVAVASVIKVVVALGFARAVVDGVLDPSERVTVPAAYQIGGTGTAGCHDPVSMSLRDLALFMMTMSDNAATDVIYHRVGQPALDRVIRDLALSSTHLREDMDTGARRAASELSWPDPSDLDAKMAAAGDALWTVALIDPERANASTAQDIAALLEAIWTDRAGPPDACALVRSLLSHQVTSHRLAAGFADGVDVAGKTGTLPAVRNEAGVVTYPDGRRYVAAIFTRAFSLADRQPAIDAAIGRAARMAIESLRLRP